jgi:hypothetical protein
LVIQRFDAKRAFVLNSAAPIRDAHGGIAGCSVAIMDITELKAIEKQLREAQKLRAWVCWPAASRTISTISKYPREFRTRPAETPQRLPG